MKTELTIISDDLNHGIIDEKEARKLLLGLLGVSGSLPSDELCRERGESFESKMYYDLGEGDYIGDFETGAKWAVDYFLGNSR